jgi:hypothetical protein
MLTSGAGGDINGPHKSLLLKAFKEHGFDAPAGAKDHDLLSAMDSVTKTERFSKEWDNRTSFGIVLALKANRHEVAQAIADTPEGGIGWSVTRQDLGARDD